jgi:CubicO group peptidase (beta-lactamase class C family)/outer membrane protein assembly factor BamB
MTRLASLPLLWQFIAIARLLEAAETPSAPDGSGDVFERAKAELRRAVQDGRVAGAAHLVVHDARMLYAEAAGFANIEERAPFTVDSILRIYSMSKPITSVAAMMLLEQGRFGLDDPVARFIPAFTNATVLVTVDGKARQVPPKRPITVRDVFRHTTGYSYGDEASVREFYERVGLRYWGPQELFPPKMTIARAADALARIPALHHPGEKFTYGFNTDLLGRLIEIWSGESLDRYLQRAVFEPLGMVDTGFSVPAEKRARFTSCSTLSEGKLAVVDPAGSSPFNGGFEFLSGGGGLVSTVRDYANFCQMLVDGGQFKGRRLLKPDTLRLMFEDQLHGVDGTNRFGLGFGIDEVELGSGAGQHKAACYRWGGYASTQFAVVPEERLFQIFALQQVPYTETLAKKQFETIYAGLPSTSTAGDSANWPQFRGPNGQGVAPAARIPVHFGPGTNVLWKLAIPPGHSSPVIWSNRLFLTATETGSPQALLTLAIDRREGRLLWRRQVQSERPGAFHPLNNAASSTPAADAQRVYVYFGTQGLICYDHAGIRLWERRLDTPKSKYGMATSPTLYRDTVILVQDSDDGRSRLLALRTDTGETAWEQPRPLFKAGWSTPMIFRHGAAEELVVLGSRRLTAYNPSTGEEIWWAGGFPEETVGVPVAGDGLLFASGAALGGRGDDQLDAAATWKTTIHEFDQNRDGQIQREEMTPGFAFIQRPELPRDNPGYGLPVNDMNVLLKIFDHDKDGVITETEWMRTMAGFAAISHPTLMALRAGAIGDARPTHVAWELRRGIPETASLLCTTGRLYLMRDGGLLTCLEAATGRELFRERIGAPGQYIASPIAAGDRLLAASVQGVVTVIQIADTLTILARNELGEGIYATPAVAGEHLYLRTPGHLYAFGP